jgi:hypothetical protein
MPDSNASRVSSAFLRASSKEAERRPVRGICLRQVHSTPLTSSQQPSEDLQQPTRAIQPLLLNSSAAGAQAGVAGDESASESGKSTRLPSRQLGPGKCRKSATKCRSLSDHGYGSCAILNKIDAATLGYADAVPRSFPSQTFLS